MADAIEAGEALPEGGDEALIAALADNADEDDCLIAASPGESVPGRNGSAAAAAQRSIRLPVSLLDDVMSCASDLVLARNDLARQLRGGDTDPAAMGRFERLSSILDQLREAVTRMRMQRLDTCSAHSPASCAIFRPISASRSWSMSRAETSSSTAR